MLYMTVLSYTHVFRCLSIGSFLLAIRGHVSVSGLAGGREKLASLPCKVKLYCGWSKGAQPKSNIEPPVHEHAGYQ